MCDVRTVLEILRIALNCGGQILKGSLDGTLSDKKSDLCEHFAEDILYLSDSQHKFIIIILKYYLYYVSVEEAVLLTLFLYFCRKSKMFLCKGYITLPLLKHLIFYLQLMKFLFSQCCLVDRNRNIKAKK